MIHIVQPTRRAEYADQMAEMNELLSRIHERRPLASDDRALSLPENTPLAIHLMKLTPEGALRAAVCLNPSEFRATPTSHVFGPAMQHLPSGVDYWDTSHFCFRETPDKQSVAFSLMMGVVEFALTWGINHINFLVEEDLQLAIKLLPFQVEFVSDPVEISGLSLVPSTIRVSQEALQELRTFTGMESPTLHLPEDSASPSTEGR